MTTAEIIIDNLTYFKQKLFPYTNELLGYMPALSMSQEAAGLRAKSQIDPAGSIEQLLIIVCYNSKLWDQFIDAVSKINPSAMEKFGKRPASPTKSYELPSPTKSYEPPSPTKSYEPPSPTKSYEPPSPTKSYEPPSSTKFSESTAGKSNINALHNNLHDICVEIAPRINEIILAMPNINRHACAINMKAASRSDPVGVSRDLLLDHVKIRELWTEFFEALEKVGLSSVKERYFS
jgi:hypothetical protein